MTKFTRRQFAIASLGATFGAATARAQRLPPAKNVPWLAEVQTPPEGIPADVLALGPLLVDDQGKRITTWRDWLVQRDKLRTAWLQTLGAWKRGEEPPPEFDVLLSERVGGVVRQRIAYESEPSVSVEAYLLSPDGAGERRPGVVIFHSTVAHTIRQGAGLEGPPELHWGLKLAQRGFVALCPRCFLWDGNAQVDYAERVREHALRHPAARGIAKMLFDAGRAVDLLASLPEIDRDRLGAAGHSLGAKEALYLTAFDDRIKAAVSSEGGIGTTFSNWDAPWYLDNKQLGREHHELLALAAPRAFLLVGGNSADGVRSWPFVAAALEVYRLFASPAKIGLLNHGQGHTVPPQAEQRTYEWLQAYV